MKIIQTDMDLRSYFAAHAPPVPGWFFGVDPRPRRPQPPHFEDSRLQDLVRQWKMDDVGLDLEEFINGAARDTEISEEQRAAIHEFDHRLEIYREHCEWYENTLDHRRYAQWPWYYADMVLANQKERK